MKIQKPPFIRFSITLQIRDSENQCDLIARFVLEKWRHEHTAAIINPLEGTTPSSGLSPL